MIGSGFRGGETVLFNGVPAVRAEVLTSVEILVTAPAQLTPGPVDVEVVRTGERALLVSAFEYILPPLYPDIVSTMRPYRMGPTGHSSSGTSSRAFSDHESSGTF